MKTDTNMNRKPRLEVLTFIGRDYSLLSFRTFTSSDSATIIPSSIFYSEYMRVVDYHGQDTIRKLVNYDEFYVTCRYILPGGGSVRVPLKARFSTLDLGDEFCTCLDWKVKTSSKNSCQILGFSGYLKGIQRVMIERYGVGFNSDIKASHLTSEELISDRVLAIMHALTLIQAIGLST